MRPKGKSQIQALMCESSAGGVDRIQGTTKEEHTKQAGGSYSASQREVLKETKE